MTKFPLAILCDEYSIFTQVVVDDVGLQKGKNFRQFQKYRVIWIAQDRTGTLEWRKSRPVRMLWSPQQISNSLWPSKISSRGMTYSTIRYAVSPTTQELKYLSIAGCRNLFKFCRAKHNTLWRHSKNTKHSEQKNTNLYSPFKLLAQLAVSLQFPNENRHFNGIGLGAPRGRMQCPHTNPAIARLINIIIR